MSCIQFSESTKACLIKNFGAYYFEWRMMRMCGKQLWTKNNNKRFKGKQSNGKENKRKIKFEAHMWHVSPMQILANPILCFVWNVVKHCKTQIQHSLNQIKIKRKNKNNQKGKWSFFDQVNMKPTLDPNAAPVLN